MLEERNYLRKSYRIQLPAKVYIDGKEYKVLDWSFLGFRIEKEEFYEFNSGEEYIVDFELPFASFNATFKAKAVVRWSSAKEAGFEFTEISDEAKLLMKDYVEAYIEGRLTNAEGLLAVSEGLELPVEVEPEITEEEKKKLDTKLKKALGIVFFVVVSVLSIGYLIYKNMPIVYSAQAFVSGKSINILAPENGIISNIYVKAGEFVKKQSPLFSIRNEEVNKEIDNLNLLYNEKKKILEKLYQNLKKLKKTSNVYSKIKLVSLKNQLKLLNLQLQEKQEELKTLEKAYDMYLIKKSDIDKVKGEIQELKIKIANLKETIKAYETLNQPVDDISIKLSQQINKLTIELQSIKEKLLTLKNMRKNWIVFAKKDGYILSINKREGEIVKKFDPVMVMDIKTNEIYVVARFKVEDALKIKIGNKAEVLIPSIGKIYKGKVVSIGKTSIASDSIVSETEAYALKDVPVKIKINTKDEDIYSGMYAEAKVITESRYVFIIDFFARLLGQ